MRHLRIIVTHYGGPDELRVVEEDCPEPKDGEVRVRVLAAGVAYPDLLMREGVHPEKPPLPFYAGVGSGRRCGAIEVFQSALEGLNDEGFRLPMTSTTGC